MPDARLFILRHASAAPAAGQSDHERPLDRRGRAEARRLSTALAPLAAGLRRVVTSDARRALETLEGVRFALPPDVEILVDGDLYAGGAEAYAAAARRAGPLPAVMLVGHNPMIEAFTRTLVAGGDPGGLARLEAGFPKAGCAVVDLDGPLSGLSAGAGRLHALLTGDEG